MHTDYEDSVFELLEGKELSLENLYKHARDVIKGRWPEAEPFIMKDPTYAYYYAKDVIKDRWPEAEPAIRINLEAWIHYCIHLGISE